MHNTGKIFCAIIFHFAGVVLCVDLTKVGNKFYYISNVTANWHYAMLQCHKLGLHLASVQDHREQQELTNYLNSTKTKNLIHWLGGTDLHEESQWIWSSTGDPIYYSAWRPGEPNNVDSYEHCLVIVTITMANWVDIPCNRTDPLYICQLDTDIWKKLHVQLTTTFDGYQFYVHKDNLWVSWSEAQELCHGFGMELAEIDSKEKNTFLTTYLKNLSSILDKDFWLGGIKDGNWTWINSRRQIKIWTDNKTLPSSDGCLEIRLSGSWFVTKCSYKQRFVCQLKVPTVTTSSTNTTPKHEKSTLFKTNGLIFLMLFIASVVVTICISVVFCVMYRRLNQRFVMIKSNYIEMTKGNKTGESEDPIYDDVRNFYHAS